MPSRQVVMRKLVNSTLHDVYPATLASIVQASNGETVQELLNLLLYLIKDVASKANVEFAIPTYEFDENGNIIVDDENTGIVQMSGAESGTDETIYMVDANNVALTDSDGTGLVGLITLDSEVENSEIEEESVEDSDGLVEVI